MGTVEKRCVIVCASPTADRNFILSQLREDDFIICADGGADQLVGTTIVPDMIVGDLDSSNNYSVFEGVNLITLDKKKDDTDTMHCATVALEMGYKNFMLLGALGGRLDHTICNLSVLLYLQKYGANGVISDEFSTVSLLQEGLNEISNVNGKTISVIPFSCDSAILTYSGLLYPMNNEIVTSDYPFTISNVAQEDTVYITLHSGKALLVVSV